MFRLAVVPVFVSLAMTVACVGVETPEPPKVEEKPAKIAQKNLPDSIDQAIEWLGELDKQGVAKTYLVKQGRAAVNPLISAHLAWPPRKPNFVFDIGAIATLKELKVKHGDQMIQQAESSFKGFRNLELGIMQQNAYLEATGRRADYELLKRAVTVTVKSEELLKMLQSTTPSK